MKFLQPVRFLVQLACLSVIALGIAHVHKSAPYLAIAAVVFGVFFCGWVCPFGTFQEWIGKIGTLLKIRKYKLPLKYHKRAQVLRYLIYSIILSGVAYTFINSRSTFSKIMHGDMISDLALIVFGIFALLSIFVDRPFCNYFCEVGASHGLLSIFRFFSIKKNSNCRGCKLCDQNCPMNINVSKERFVRHPHCINCFKCVSGCSQKALEYRND